MSDRVTLVSAKTVNIFTASSQCVFFSTSLHDNPLPPLPPHCRLLISPLVFIAVEELLVTVNFVPRSERMLRLLICIMAAVPSAQMVIVSLNQADAIDIAARLAYMFVFQYLASVFTTAMWISIAIHIIY